MDYAATMATGFSTRPLRLIALLGLLFAAGGVVGAGIDLIDHVFNGGQIVDSALVITLVFLLTGVQLMALGVVGEYVGRVHERLLAKPTYLVRRTVGQPLRAARLSEQPQRVPAQSQAPDQ